MDFSRMPVVVLPKINGPEAYARMIAERPDVPVIFATGHSPDIALLHKVQERGLAVLRRPPRTQAHEGPPPRQAQSIASNGSSEKSGKTSRLTQMETAQLWSFCARGRLCLPRWLSCPRELAREDGS